MSTTALDHLFTEAPETLPPIIRLLYYWDRLQSLRGQARLLAAMERPYPELQAHYAAVLHQAEREALTWAIA